MLISTERNIKGKTSTLKLAFTSAYKKLVSPAKMVLDYFFLYFFLNINFRSKSQAC